MIPKVKICGITNLEDALAAQRYGADALGFIFYPKSPRYIQPRDARRIIVKLSKKIKKIGVFVNPLAAYATRIATLCGLDMLQFHGDEPPDFCRKFPGHTIIKAFRVKGKHSLTRIHEYKTDYYLFDTYVKGSFGGTGKRCNWPLIKKLKTTRPFFISGGLNPENVAFLIKAVHPDWVDVSSGVEVSAGIKDKGLMRKFMAQVRAE